jgi:hypothetical protein
MLVHISPCEEDVGETICSLSFANRARAIETYRDLTEVQLCKVLSQLSVILSQKVHIHHLHLPLVRT